MAGFAEYNRKMSSEVAQVEAYSQESLENDGASLIPIDVLPDDMLERILACLPISSILRAASVCKRWHDVVKAKRFLCNFSCMVSQRPWYFMFTCADIARGYAYDPDLRKWYGGLDLPCIESSSCIISASCGLICFMDNDERSKIFVCNPITKRWKGIEEAPGTKFSCYSSLAMWVNRKSCNYSIAVAKSKQVPNDFHQWEFSIHAYGSEVGYWSACTNEVFSGWRGGDEGVICNGILYCLIYSTGIGGNFQSRHRLIMYDLSNRSSRTSLLSTSMAVPCPLTCGRLMNLKEKLIMVGGIGKPDRADVIKGIGIWELNGQEWREVARMPHRFFQGFGEFDDVFASSGTDTLIYVHSYGSPALLVYDMDQRQWKWSQKCPINKRFPLQMFTGFCFEPRLEVSP